MEGKLVQAIILYMSSLSKALYGCALYLDVRNPQGGFLTGAYIIPCHIRVYAFVDYFFL